jgi:hypothetical protein
LTTAGDYAYKWTLTKSINDQPSGTPLQLRTQKGQKQEVKYTLTYTREVDQTTAKMTVTGEFTVQNMNPPVDPSANSTATNTLTVTAVTVTLKPNSGTAAPSTVNLACDQMNAPLAPGASTRCRFENAAYSGFLDAGTATASISFVDASAAPAVSPMESAAPSPFSFDSVTGRFATALLTDKVDLTSINSLYTGFSGFQNNMVWRYLDVSQQIPDAGVTVEDSGTKTCARWGAGPGSGGCWQEGGGQKSAGILEGRGPQGAWAQRRSWPAPSATGRVGLWLAWGGNAAYNPNPPLLLAPRTPSNPAATRSA